MKPTSAERADLYARGSYRTILARVAANARRLREGRGWTQVQAAAECSMATFVLQTVESGRRNLSATTLARLCDGFGVDIQELLLPAAPLAEPKRGRPKKASAAADGKPEPASSGKVSSATTDSSSHAQNTDSDVGSSERRQSISEPEEVSRGA